MTRKKSPEKDKSKEDLGRRLDSINSRLGRDKPEAEEDQHRPSRNSFGNAFRLSSEFIAAILVGVAIGYGIDWLAGTTPWAMILFLFLGFVAGVMNVLRASGELTGQVDLGNSGSSETKD